MSQDTTPKPGGETDIEFTSLQVTEDFQPIPQCEKHLF
jgi:hypothetical protein